MHLELRRNTWDRTSVVIPTQAKDYDSFDGGDVAAFVYGYPFDDRKATWFSAKNAHGAYLQHNLDFSKDIDGVYSVLIIDRKKRRCFVVVDRYGIYALFFACCKDRTVLSDDIGWLAASGETGGLNRESIIEYLCLGFKLGNKTHLEGVYQFEPASIYEIDENLQMTQRGYWDSLAKREERRTTLEEIRRGFNGHVLRAMGLEPTAALPLTGGIDTRTILSACLGQKDRLRCYTHGVPGSIDVQMARRISAHFRIAHDSYELGEDWAKSIPDLLKARAGMLNGLVPALTFLHADESARKQAAKSDMLVPGVLGNEVWRCVFGKAAAGAETTHGVASRIASFLINVKEPPLDVFEGYDSAEARALLEDAVGRELPSIETVGSPVASAEVFVLRSYAWNWASNSIKALGRRFKIFPGLLQKDLVRRVRLMPLEKKLEGGAQKYIIRANSPYLAGLPLASAKLIAKTPRAQLASWEYVLSTYVNLACRRLFGTQPIRRHGVFIDYPRWMRDYHSGFVRDVLRPEGMVTGCFFRKKRLQSLVDAFLAGDRRGSPFILSLISLEMWLRTIR